MKRVALALLGLALTSCSSCEAPSTEPLERGAEALEAQARRALERSGTPHESEAEPPPEARDGNRARLLINGEASFLERMRLIDSAERSILVQALIFKADTVGGAIADRLIERKREDPELDIRVIVDAYSNIRDYDAQMLYFELMDAGIEVQGYEPLYLEWIDEINATDWLAGEKRYHEKYFIVDGERAVVGGMNIGDEYARIGDDPARIWRDQDVYLEGPVVRDIEAAFDENFAHFRGIQGRRPRALDSDVYWSAWRRVHPRLRGAVTRSVGRDRAWRSSSRRALDAEALQRAQVPSELHSDVRVRFIRSRPRVGERWIEAAYLRRIRAATSSVVIANAYFIPTDPLRDALIAAAERGVEVTVITNSKATNDIPMINDAGRIAYRPLMEAGVRVYEWHSEAHGEGTLHAKFAVFDAQVAIIGSYNLDPRSLALNSEDVVVIEDGSVAEELAAYVAEHDLALTREVTDDEAERWADPALIPLVDRMPNTPWWDPAFEADRFELFLIHQASRHL